MQEAEEQLRALHENLDTAYVDVVALVRHLEARGATCLIHVELDEYEGDVYLRGGEATGARGRDHATGAAEEGDAALARLFSRAREPGGLVSVYECTPEQLDRVRARGGSSSADAGRGESTAGSEEGEGQEELLRLAGEMVGAVERAVMVAGGDFDAAVHAARLRLAEDFPFLDPFARRFEYEGGVVRLHVRPSERLFASGLCEMLRAAVAHVADAEQRLGVRKDAARELSILLRRRRSQLERFKLTPRQLERIAGMKLL
jgi:hypothetical protein